MKFVSINELKPGSILAREVEDNNGRTLAEQNSTLSERMIERLRAAGHTGVYVQDDLKPASESEEEGTISRFLRDAAMACVMQRDVDGCGRIAEQIVEELMQKQKASLDLVEVRTNDDYVYAHSVNVAILCALVGMGFELRKNELYQLTWAGLIHDLGKLDIPSVIRNKESRLTREEFQIMKTHAVLSYEYIKDRTDISAQIKVAVRSHHENVDGSGYPDGSLGDEQSLFTKIIHVADVYDALISNSPYKKAYSSQEATEYLMGGCGLLFDKDVVSMLLQYVPMYPMGSEVVFVDGRKGTIVDNRGVHNLRPVVKLANGILVDLAEPENFSITIKNSEEMAISEAYEKERKRMIGEEDRPKLLVVDDMKTNLQMMIDMLSDEYDLILAKSGRQALAYIDKKGAPDLILMDIDMPEMDGIETARRIKAKTVKKVPLIFVTSLCDRETVLRCRELSPESYIVRPYNPVYVKTEISRILEWGH